MKWKNVSVRQYQQLVELGKMELSDKEATTEAIAILSGMTINQVRQLSERDLIKWERRIGFIHQELKPSSKRYIKVNGRTYATNVNVRHMPSARYIESKYFGQDIIGNMHKLGAVMVYPVRWSWFKYVPIDYDTLNFPQYTDDMSDASVVDVLGVMVFFLSKIKAIDDEFVGLFGQASEQQVDDVDTIGNDVHPFQKQYGWIYQTVLVAQHNNITLEAAYCLPTIQFLNDLAYIKSKSEFDAYLLKTAHGQKH